MNKSFKLEKYEWEKYGNEIIMNNKIFLRNKTFERKGRRGFDIFDFDNEKRSKGIETSLSRTNG